MVEYTNDHYNDKFHCGHHGDAPLDSLMCLFLLLPKRSSMLAILTGGLMPIGHFAARHHLRKWPQRSLTACPGPPGACARFPYVVANRAGQSRALPTCQLGN